MTNPTGAGPDPVATWQKLYLGAPHAAPSVAASVAAAFRLADQVWRQVAADPTRDASTRFAVTDEAAWARTALAAFEHLADTRAYAHLDLPARLRCAVDARQLVTWLTGPSDLPGFAHTTVAESWNVDDDFTWDAVGVGTTMAMLVDQAQSAGQFGVPGYLIVLRQVTTDDPDDEPVIEHQVNLITPSGATLAAAPMATDHLAEDNLAGVDAALAVLTNTAAVVNELLEIERRLVLAAPDVAQPARTVRPGRGFTALDLTSATLLPTAIEAPGPRPDRPPRR